MTMEALNRAGVHPDNQDPTKQFAIRQAGALLVAADVKDPGPLTVERFSPVLPEGVIRLPDLEIGGKTPKQLEEVWTSGGFKVSDYASSMLRSRDFTTLPKQQIISLVRANALNLGMTGFPTLPQIMERARTFNLGECPAEVAVYLRMADKNQPLNDTYFLAMKPIAGSDGGPGVFRLVRYGDGSWLDGHFANPGDRWLPEREFVFSVRPPAGEASK